MLGAVLQATGDASDSERGYLSVPNAGARDEGADS